jgi:hypothetical protein
MNQTQGIGEVRCAGSFTTPAPDRTILVQTDCGKGRMDDRDQLADLDAPCGALGDADALKLKWRGKVTSFADGSQWRQRMPRRRRRLTTTNLRIQNVRSLASLVDLIASTTPDMR